MNWIQPGAAAVHYKTGQLVGAAWLDFGANALAVVFLLPGSLFAPSLSACQHPLSKHTRVLQPGFHLKQSI